MKIFNKKNVLIGIAIVGVLFLPIHLANAQAINPGNIAAFAANADKIGKAAGKVAGYFLTAATLSPILAVSSILATLGGITITLVTSMIGGLIEANSGIGGSIVNSLMVRAGFDVMLSITNLGFVAAMIFIAIATILRLQTYNVKKTLWKLIVAALLVNFSLVFAGGILNLSDQLTGFFLKGITGGGVVGSGNAISARLMAVFNAYKLQNPQDNPALAAALNGGNVKGFFAAVEAGFEEAAVEVIALLFTTVGIWIIAMAFGVLGFAIFARYIVISILLILMPIVWLFWIFPGLSQHWSKWWSTFFRWVFFMPVMLFFLWLVLSVGTVLQNPGSNEQLAKVTAVADPNNPVLGPQSALATFSPNDGGLFVSIMGTFLQGMIVVGLLVGGLIAANKLSITGAGVALSAVKGIGKQGGKAAGSWYANKAGSRAGGLFKPPQEGKKGPLNTLRRVIHQRAEKEAAAGKPGVASKLADFGRQSAVRTSARNEAIAAAGGGVMGQIVGRTKYAASATRKSLFGFNKDSLFGAVTLGALKGSGLIKSKMKVKPSMSLDEFMEVTGIDDPERAKETAERMGVKIGEKKGKGGGEEAQKPKPLEDVNNDIAAQNQEWARERASGNKS